MLSILKESNKNRDIYYMYHLKYFNVFNFEYVSTILFTDSL